MNIYFLFSLFVSFFCIENNSVAERFLITKDPLHIAVDYEWAVIGAGVAGGLSISILRDLGIPFHLIYWVDPLFNVGRIGEYYQNVSGNTPNWLWADFLRTSPTIFSLVEDDIFYIDSLDPKGYSTLAIIAQPMQKVTDYFLTQVGSKKGFMDYLEFYDDVWHIGVQGEVKTARNVILATGSRPKAFEYHKYSDVIPLDYALDPEILSQLVKKTDTIGVFGGSHSAILILKHLYENVEPYRIYNFYKYPLLFAVDMGTWTLYSTNGLKGETALWAKTVLEVGEAKNIFRVKNTLEERNKYLPLCNKVIYAIGYEKNPLPEMIFEGDELPFHFNPETGIIGTRIFGIGLAFPGEFTDPLGNKEQLIGVNSFMKFALKVMPEWVKMKLVLYKDALCLRLHQLSFLDNFIKINLL